MPAIWAAGHLCALLFTDGAFRTRKATTRTNALRVADIANRTNFADSSWTITKIGM
jgi:hypothetical protein